MNRLDVKDLSVGYRKSSGELVPAVIRASLSLEPGSSLGIVGESGSGKSTLARALLGHCRAGGVISGGSVSIDGRQMVPAPTKYPFLGAGVAFVPQNPLSSLTPHIRVGAQVAEAVRANRRCSADEARHETLELFRATNLPNPEVLYERYPHELSGGQRQRVVIAAALACKPRLMILDEPTTALDKTTEMQVLDLVQQLKTRLNASLVYVSHDLHVISRMCSRVLVMLRGEIVEDGPVEQIYHSPQHPYTQRLIAAMPRIDAPRPAIVGAGASVPWPAAAGGETLLEVEQLCFSYGQRRTSWLRRPDPKRAALTLDRVSLRMRRGETLGLVGESGSGKSTVAAILAGLRAPASGRMSYAGKPLPPLAAQRSVDLRRRIQVVFQDPLSSLNPRQRVGAILSRPLEKFFRMSGAAARQRVLELMAEMQLDAALIDAWPRQLSGGQQQRVAIARAFAAQPELIICDEITSALDVSVQAEVLALLRRLQENTGTSLLFISHDLGVIRQLAHQVVVLQQGAVREAGPVQDVFASPRHPYTRLLLDAAGAAAGHPQDTPALSAVPAPADATAPSHPDIAVIRTLAA